MSIGVPPDFGAISRVSGLGLSALGTRWPGADGSVRRTSSDSAAYFQVTSIPKKCANTSRFGLFFGFCSGLRM
jgi:hypothetical protein